MTHQPPRAENSGQAHNYHFTILLFVSIFTLAINSYKSEITVSPAERITLCVVTWTYRDPFLLSDCSNMFVVSLLEREGPALLALAGQAAGLGGEAGGLRAAGADATASNPARGC